MPTLLLEAVRAVPLQEMGVRPIGGAGRRGGIAARVDDPADGVGIIGLARYEDGKIIGERQQPAVEHPVRGAQQREPVADDIGAVRLDRADMRRLDLGAAAAVDQLQPGDRAAFVKSAQDGAAEYPVADYPGGEAGDARTLALDQERAALLVPMAIVYCVGHGIAGARQQRGLVVEAERDDPIEVGSGDRAHRRLGTLDIRP